MSCIVRVLRNPPLLKADTRVARACRTRGASMVGTGDVRRRWRGRFRCAPSRRGRRAGRARRSTRRCAPCAPGRGGDAQGRGPRPAHWTRIWQVMRHALDPNMARVTRLHRSPVVPKSVTSHRVQRASHVSPDRETAAGGNGKSHPATAVCVCAPSAHRLRNCCVCARAAVRDAPDARRTGQGRPTCTQRNDVNTSSSYCFESRRV